MTAQELAALPVGSIVKLDGEEGEIIQDGQEVHILWPESKITNIIHTKSTAWTELIAEMEAE